MRPNHLLQSLALTLSLAASTLHAQVDWPHTQPSAQHIDATALQSLFATLTADPHKDIKGVVILRHNTLVAESYFNGDTAASLHDIRSATKSITATLMGIAIEHHFIRSVDDPISLYLPSLPPDKHSITIRDLLNMRSGLDANDEDPSTPGNEDNLDQSTDWIKTAYAVSMKRPPGEAYLYCSLNAFLTGAIIENATKLPLDVFAKQQLFGPLGINAFTWRHVPIDRITGQGNLSITTRDEARIGELFLHDGSFNGHQLVSRDWVQQSLANQVPHLLLRPLRRLLRLHVVLQSRARRRPHHPGPLRLRQRRQQDLHRPLARHGRRHHLQRLQHQLRPTPLAGNPPKNPRRHPTLTHPLPSQSSRPCPHSTVSCY